MDPFRSQDRTRGFVVRLTSLDNQDPDFLQTKLMIYANFHGFKGKLSLTLHTLQDAWVDCVRSTMPSYRSLNPFRNGVESGGIHEDRYDFEERPAVDSEIESMLVDLFSLRKLGYTALMVQGEGVQSAKKYVLHFNRMVDCELAVDIAQRARAESSGEFLPFEHRTFLFNQRILLKDKRRLEVYKEIFQKNSKDFEDKVVLDVGCGLGMLSLFAVRASPRIIYAVEPSRAALIAENVVMENHRLGKIKIFHSRVESVELPSKVDVIISDNFGEMLLNGQMLKSFLIAKQRFLKRDGKMYPATGTLILRPSNVSDYEAMIRGDIWNWARSEPKRGLFSAQICHEAVEERLYRPVLRTNTEDRAFATCHEQVFDFASLTPEKLQQIEFPFSCTFLKPGIVKAFTFTFRLSFNGTESQDTLNAEYDGEPTRWRNVFCLLHKTLSARAAETIKGTCKLLANEFHSYDIEIKIDFRREHYECKYRLEYGSSIARNI